MKGKYYRDWLVEDDTVTHCFIEGEIHWDKVDKSDIDLMIINLLQDQDNTEHTSNILFKMHNSSDVADSLGHRGANQPRRWELLGVISLLSPAYLLFVNR